MLTTKDLKTQCGDNITFLFKGTEPFTETKNGKPAGVLIERDGKIQCYECGKWFKTLGRHVKCTHKMTVWEYKEKYGFNKKAGLCSKKVSKAHSDSAIKRGQGMIGAKNFKKIERITNGNLGKKLSIQSKNKRFTCPAQYDSRLELLMMKGGEMTVLQAKKMDCGAFRWGVKNYGSWNKTRKHFGLPVSQNKKEKADLVYDLREYVKDYNESPWYFWNTAGHRKHETKNGFLHSVNCYRRHFGSMVKARLHCGIKVTKKCIDGNSQRRYWEVID